MIFTAAYRSHVQSSTLGVVAPPKPLRLIRPHEHRRMPWKNGGGSTSEIFVLPGEGDRYRYRVSVADVASDGPFSRFDGYERHIALLEGAGMTLDAGPHGRIELLPLTPRAFSGDWDVTGTLKAGPVRDFNLIVDRAYATATLEVESAREPIEEDYTLVDEHEIRFFHAASGSILIGHIRPL